MIAAARLIASVLGLLTALVLARVLGPAGRGLTAALLGVLYILPIVVSLGAPIEIRRVAADDDGPETLRAARVAAVGSGALAIPAGFAVAEMLVPGGHPSLYGSVVAAVSLLPVTVGWMNEQSYLIGRERYLVVAAMQIVPPVVLLAGCLGLGGAGLLSEQGVVVLATAGAIANMIVGLCANKVSVRGPRLGVRNLLGRSIRFAGSSIAEAASNRADQVVALPLLGAQQAGYYSVAVTVGSIPFAFAYALGAHELNYLRASLRSDVKNRSASGVRAALALSGAVTVILAVAVPFMIPIVFGTDYEPAITPTEVLLIGALAIIPNYVCSMHLASLGRGWAMTLLQMAGLVLSLILLVILGPWLGAHGAAAAAALGYWTTFFVALRLLEHKLATVVPKPRDLIMALERLRGGQ